MFKFNEDALHIGILNKMYDKMSDQTFTEITRLQESMREEMRGRKKETKKRNAKDQRMHKISAIDCKQCILRSNPRYGYNISNPLS